MLEISVPSSFDKLNAVRSLMAAYIGWHRHRHHQDLALIDTYFDAVAFEQELASLPGDYAAPRGELLLATLDGSPAGCVALRSFDETRCEMKRMFVLPEHHGNGIGRALGESIIRAAEACGYKAMLLDTSVRQSEAQGLYRRLGFSEIAPYYQVPNDMRDWLVFMERPIGV